MRFPEKMSTELLREVLGDMPLELCVLETVDSTNAEARRAVLSGACLPTAFFASLLLPFFKILLMLETESSPAFS